MVIIMFETSWFHWMLHDQLASKGKLKQALNKLLIFKRCLFKVYKQNWFNKQK